MGALGAWFLPIGLLMYVVATASLLTLDSFALTGDRGHWTGPIIVRRMSRRQWLISPRALRPSALA